MHLQPSNYSIGHKIGLECVPSNHSEPSIADHQLNQCPTLIMLAVSVQPSFLSAIQNDITVLLCGARSVSLIMSVIYVDSTCHDCIHLLILQTADSAKRK